jgi:hypothetical protein
MIIKIGSRHELQITTMKQREWIDRQIVYELVLEKLKQIAHLYSKPKRRKTLSKNDDGTHMADHFTIKEGVVMGCLRDGVINDLSRDQIDWCKSNNFLFMIPYNLYQSTTARKEKTFDVDSFLQRIDRENI